MKRVVLILLAFFALTSSYGQQSLNDYKYVVVPEKFDFLKEADQYRLNSLTKFLFEKYNFEALKEGEIFPSDYGKNNCLGLKADVLNNSNMFKTKLSVQLKNCKNEVIYTSREGESREKNYKIAYNEALRNAFKSIEAENYSYNPKNAIIKNDDDEVVEEKQQEINKLKEEVKTLKAQNNNAVIKVNNEEEITLTNQQKQEVEPVVTPETTNYRLRAEPISKSVFGYHLINSDGEQVYTILFSGKVDLYIVKGRDAVIYKLNKAWVIAEVQGDALQVKTLDIKF